VYNKYTTLNPSFSTVSSSTTEILRLPTVIPTNASYFSQPFEMVVRVVARFADGLRCVCVSYYRFNTD